MWPGIMQVVTPQSMIRDLYHELEDGQFLADQIMDAYRNTFNPAGMTTLTDKDEHNRALLEDIMWENAVNHGRIANLTMPSKHEFLETWRRKAWEHVREHWFKEQHQDELGEMDVNSAYPTIPVQLDIPDFPEDFDRG